MKHLIVGAGATLAQALDLGVPHDSCPPLIRDFARKTWWNYTPYPFLEPYLVSLGHDKFGSDARETFYELENRGDATIEGFLEFAWHNRKNERPLTRDPPPPGFISGLRLIDSGDKAPLRNAKEDYWSDLLYHGIGSPLQLMMIACFFANGVGWKDLAMTRQVASKLARGDLVLNLNYDTVFELALEQQGIEFSYVPDSNKIVVCKPHGSLNMVTNETGFAFGEPGWLGMPQPPGYSSYSGIVPPRLNKCYSQHPAARVMLDWVKERRPSRVIMWGVGLTESDHDLMELYAGWLSSVDLLEVINPSKDIAARAESCFGVSVAHYSSISDWLASQGRVHKNGIR